MSDSVYIIGVGMIKFGKYLKKSVKDLTGETLDLVLKDSDLKPEDIEAAWFSNCSWGIYDFQHCIRGQVALTANGLDKIPIINVENACASASTALHSGWMAIKAGIYDCVLAIGVEKLYDEDRKKVMQGFIAGTDVEETTQLIEEFKKQQKEIKKKEAAEKKNQIGKAWRSLRVYGFLCHGGPLAHETVRHHPTPVSCHCCQSP